MNQRGLGSPVTAAIERRARYWTVHPIAKVTTSGVMILLHAAQGRRSRVAGPTIDRILDVILQEIGRPGAFDFGDRAFVSTLRDDGAEIASDRCSWHLPPADILFAQRKVSGTALLAARLKAKVDVRSLIAGKLADAKR